MLDVCVYQFFITFGYFYYAIAQKYQQKLIAFFIIIIASYSIYIKWLAEVLIDVVNEQRARADGAHTATTKEEACLYLSAVVTYNRIRRPPLAEEVFHQIYHRPRSTKDLCRWQNP